MRRDFVISFSGYRGRSKYNGSDNLLNSSYTKNTGGKTFDNGPAIYYMPFSAMKEEAWVGSGHILDSEQNLVSVSIYTDLVVDVTNKLLA